jgi:hypothetical protein
VFRSRRLRVKAQHIQLGFGESRQPARLDIERSPRPGGPVAPGQIGIGAQRLEAALGAQPAVPAVADRDVTDLVAQDDVDDRRGGGVTGLGQPGPDRRRGVQAARFQGSGHERHAGQHVGLCLLDHLPQAVVRREVAVAAVQRRQMVAQQREMVRLFGGDLQPVRIVAFGHSRKAPHCVQRQVEPL